MSDALIGQLVGNYQVLARLGRANTGYIYRVRHKFLKIDRAMQVFELRTPNLSGRFAGDADRLAAIRHKSLVRVHEYGAIPNVGHFLLIELLAGESLAAALRRDRSMPVRQALKVIRDVAGGLGEAHRAGVLHRAISTRALFLAREGGVSVAKLVSFGLDLPILGEELAAALDAKLTTMDFRYASPEQLGPLPDGEVVDGRSDVYSLGLCLYEAMTGQVLFPQEDVRSALAARLETENVSPADRAPDAGIDPDLDELVVRMLAPSRFMRPNDAHEVAAELDAMLLRVRRPGRGEATLPPARSRAVAYGPGVATDPSAASTARTASPQEPAVRDEVRKSRPDSAGAERAKLAAAKMKEVGPTINTAPRTMASETPASTRKSAAAASAHAAVAKAAVAKADEAREAAAKATANYAVGVEPTARRQPTTVPRVVTPSLDVPIAVAPVTDRLNQVDDRSPWIAPLVTVAIVCVIVLGLALQASRSSPKPVASEPPVTAVQTGPTLDLTRLDDVISRHDMGALDDWLSTFPRSDYRERAYQSLLDWGVAPAVVCTRMERSASDLLRPGMTFARICGH